MIGATKLLAVVSKRVQMLVHGGLTRRSHGWCRRASRICAPTLYLGSNYVDLAWSMRIGRPSHGPSGGSGG